MNFTAHGGEVEKRQAPCQRFSTRPKRTGVGKISKRKGAVAPNAHRRYVRANAS